MPIVLPAGQKEFLWPGTNKPKPPCEGKMKGKMVEWSVEESAMKRESPKLIEENNCHLLSIDEIKLYARNEQEINSLIHTTRIDSNDILMSFGMDKCGQMVSKSGKMTRTEGSTYQRPKCYSATKIQPKVIQLQYLGMLQANGNHEEGASKSAITKYLQKVRQVLKSWFNGKNKIQAINIYTISVMRYLTGIIRWLKEEIEPTEIKTKCRVPR